jgi:hypothetical protein
VIGEIYYGIGYVMMLFVIERHLSKKMTSMFCEEKSSCNSKWICSIDYNKYLLSEAIDSAISTEELHYADIDSQNRVFLFLHFRARVISMKK